MPEAPKPPTGGETDARPVVTSARPDVPARALVTSALPYANGHVHIGHLAGAYLPADIYVRYLRARGTEVAFVCGSDEHGVPTTIAAEKEGVTPQEILDRYHPANGAAFEAARVEFDIWGRTTHARHHENSQYFFKRLHERGHVSKMEAEQLHCGRCGRFLADRYVEGICHHCSATGARGDQCDACGRLVDALKLVEPRCKICGAPPEPRKTVHWYLKLGDFQERLQEWLEGRTDWRANTKQGALSWLREGLRERAITRDLDWGVKIPLDDPDAAGKVLYVWFDAPVGYLTFTQLLFEGRAAHDGEAEGWRDFWRDPSCPIVHFIGKDNIAFHAVTWPAMIMGVDDGTELPRYVVANEYLNFNRGKFSKSTGLVIYVAPFVREFGSDALRFCMAANAPESSDSEFTWDDFRLRYAELADTLGNLCHRGLTFASKRLGGRFPSADGLTDADRAALALVRETRDAAGESLLRFRFKEALSRVMELARAGNRHFDERAPWKSRKTDVPDCEAAIAASLGIVRGLATLIWPFLPEASGKLARSLGKAAPATGPGSWDGAGEGSLPAGAELGEPEVLFPKLDDAEFQARVGRVAEADR